MNVIVWMRTRLSLLACVLLMQGTAARAGLQEYVSSFDSLIQINQDASLRVTETIAVQAAGVAIKHGIYRSFPTRYGQSYSHFVSFDVESVRCQGKNVPYHLEKAFNGVHIYIGDAHTRLKPGRYTYEIVYRTGRQLGSFEDHDELYWNVTGQDWGFSIERVTARVELPQGVPARDLKAAAYRGYMGSKSQADIHTDITNGRVTFKTSEGLHSFQGLTIVVGWPKGVITGPGIGERLKWMLLDIYTLLILYAIIMLALFLFMHYRIRQENKGGTVIPLFYPPQDWSPGMVRAFRRHGYDQQSFAADIVDWAVNGYITINYNKDTYTLALTDKESDLPIIKELFGSAREVALGKKYNQKVEKTFNTLKSDAHTFLNDYFDRCIDRKTIYAIISILLFFVIEGVDSTYYGNAFAVGAIGICMLSTFAAFYWLKGYTPQGRIKRDEIEGFKLFLSTTEKERMNMVGTPPTMTPSLYEKYLPYAMALGVEERWTAQFASVFAQLEKETGVVYIPHWYYGRSSFYSYNTMGRDFSSNLGSSLKSVISSASTPPGSSSGFGGGNSGGFGRGGGSAGGGGGGGGGGGW